VNKEKYRRTIEGQVREREEGAERRVSENNNNKPNQNQSGAAVHIAATGELFIMIN
jgi:hypothetical protein